MSVKIGEFILKHMNEKQISQAELARRSGVPASTISSIIIRNNDRVAIEMMLKICDVLECDIEEYIGSLKKDMPKRMSDLFTKKYYALDKYGQNTVNVVLNAEYARCTSIPEPDDDEPKIEIKHSIYKVSAGTGFDLGNNDDWETIYIPDSPEGQKADFALTIQGNSMEPIYFDSDIVLVKEQPAVDIGQIGIFTIEGEGYIKKYGGDRLISLNAEYDDIVFSDYDEERIRCVGKVIGRV